MTSEDLWNVLAINQPDEYNDEEVPLDPADLLTDPILSTIRYLFHKNVGLETSITRISEGWYCLGHVFSHSSLAHFHVIARLLGGDQINVASPSLPLNLFRLEMTLKVHLKPRVANFHTSFRNQFEVSRWAPRKATLTLWKESVQTDQCRVLNNKQTTRRLYSASRWLSRQNIYKQEAYLSAELLKIMKQML